MNITTSEVTQEAELNDLSASTARLTSSAPVQMTLVALYCLPILLLTIAAIASSGFKVESLFLTVTLNIVTQYIQTLREAFATFVIPFVTAISAGRWTEATKGGVKPMLMFFVLVAILVTAIFLGAFLNAKTASFQSIQASNPATALEAFKQATEIIQKYVKEVLTYISLLLGLSLWKKG